jgi:hypothetical protein
MLLLLPLLLPLLLLLPVIMSSIQGQSWSTATSTLRAPASFITPPYDTDGNPAVLSAAERAEIWNIHSAVAEDFSLWDVDVTTEDPGAAGISRCATLDLLSLTSMSDVNDDYVVKPICC